MDIAELLADAERNGYTLNFAVEDDRIKCAETGEIFNGDDVEAIYSQSVDSGTDPGDDATLYLIETTSGSKGYLIVADSFHTNPQRAAFIRDLVRGRGTKSVP